jgi:LmbE family N-acetylglucosaminyl deacetylase
VPDGSEPSHALARTTHLGVGAHQDDLELMAAHGIFECFQAQDRWFTGVIVTDGRASHGEPLAKTRACEQRKAAVLAEYSAQIQLGFSSLTVKAASASEHLDVVLDLERVLRATRPEVIYTHNLADKHDTHVAVCLRLLQACQRLSPEERPRRVIGCEVWRDLDWLIDADKCVMPVDEHEGLQAALVAVFDSQIAGGKRYDLAGMGRRRAHATFFESHEHDRHTGLVFGMDLTPLLAGGDPSDYASSFVQRLEADICARIARLSRG